MRRSVASGSVLVVAVWAGLSACSTVPETGRPQFVITSPAEDAQMGLSAFQQIKRQTPVSHNTAANAQVQRVGRRLASVVNVPYAQWEFVVFDDSEANAFALPGGKVGVNTGILPITRTDAGLAAVIGHEIGHVVARHGGERMSQEMLTQLGGTALDIGLEAGAGISAGGRQAAQVLYGLGANVGVMLPYSRTHEAEADRLGMLYMARAGYDPREAIAFWKRFAAYNEREGDRAPELLRTHPLDAHRIANLEKYLPEALAAYRRP